MAKQTKISAETQKKLNTMGINAKSEEQAKEKLIEILEDNGIEGMEDEDLETLIEIAESFVDESGTEEPEEEIEETEEKEQSEEEEAKELAEEAAEEEEPEEEEEEPEEEPDEFDEMDRKELKDFIKEHGYDIKVTKSKSDDDLRDEVRNAFADEEAKKAAAAKKAKKQEKPAKKETKKESKKEEKAEKKTAKKASSKQVLSPKEKKEDREHFDFLKELFPEGEYEYAWVTGGVSIKHVGKNGKRNIMSVKHCTLVNGVMKCSVYLPTLCKKTEVLDNAGLEYGKIGISGDPYMNGVLINDEFIETLQELMPDMLEVVSKIDKKLGENRKKMEEELEKKAKPTDNKTAKKAAKKEEEPEEKPTKKAAKPAKKTAKK